MPDPCESSPAVLRRPGRCASRAGPSEGARLRLDPACGQGPGGRLREGDRQEGGPRGRGSSAGAQALQSGEVTLAFLSRALKATETAAGLVGQTYALDGIAIIAHKDNPQANLTLAELKDLYTGKTSAWADGRPAVLFNRNADSGSREVFQEVVLGKDTFTDKASVKHDGILLSTVAKVPSALAYTSVAEADESKVKVLTVNGVKPSAATLRDKTYPIFRTPTLATKGAAPGDKKAFIDFALGPQGQAIVAAQGIVPTR